VTPRIPPIALVALVLALIAGAACESGRQPVKREAVFDSAGVSIAENPDTATDTVSIPIEATPALSIGRDSTDSRYTLARIRNAVRLSDGRIVVALDGTQELRYFDSTGKFLLSVGRKGRGPGEFGHMTAVARSAGDSVFVYDNDLMRITVVDSSGRVARSISVSMFEGRQPEPAYGRLPDGTWLMAVARRPGADPPSGRAVPIITDVVRYDSEGRPMGRVGDSLVSHRVLLTLPGSKSPTYWDIPFTPRGLIAIGGDGYFTGDGSSYRVNGFGPNGPVRRIVRRTRRAAPLLDDSVRRFRENELARAATAEERRMTEAWLSMMPYPKEIPQYSGLMADPLGRLWVRRWALEPERAPWDVYDAKGKPIGRALLPEGLRATELGPDYVLGVRRDANGVDLVEVYRFRLPG
jgi:hypothetical protein